jgi:hypothetical protein
VHLSVYLGRVGIWQKLDFKLSSRSEKARKVFARHFSNETCALTSEGASANPPIKSELRAWTLTSIGLVQFVVLLFCGLNETARWKPLSFVCVPVVVVPVVVEAQVDAPDTWQNWGVE